MTANFRLYENVWVMVEGVEAPMQAHRSPENPGAFHVGAHVYDVDARAVMKGAPRLLSILSLQAMSHAGLLGRGGDMPAKGPTPSTGKLRWSFLRSS